MGLTMEQQKVVASQMARRYRQASKKKKGQIIEEYMGLTGCTRHHAAWLLGHYGLGPPRWAAGQDRGRPAPPTPTWS